MSPELRLTLTAQASEARQLRSELHAWLLDVGIDGATGHDITLAVNEAFVNAVEHPLQRRDDTVTIRGRHDNSEVIVNVCDHGRWAHDADPSRDHYGQKLMRTLVDRVQIQTGDHGTTVTLHKTLERVPS
jgi:anti-sigma regulatory factor (Ser/Thr protein kinase)